MGCCPTVKRFCCMKLETAGVVIGWTSGVFAFIKAIVYFLAILNAPDIFGNLSVFQEKKVQFTLYVGLSVCLLFAVLDFIASGLVIVGTRNNHHLFILPWLINSAIIFGFKVLANLLYIWILYEHGQSGGQLHGLVIFVVYFAISVWTWIVIFSLFKAIRKSKEDVDLHSLTAYSTDYKVFNNCEDPQSKRF